MYKCELFLTLLYVAPSTFLIFSSLTHHYSPVHQHYLEISTFTIIDNSLYSPYFYIFKYHHQPTPHTHFYNTYNTFSLLHSYSNLYIQLQNNSTPTLCFTNTSIYNFIYTKCKSLLTLLHVALSTFSNYLLMSSALIIFSPTIFTNFIRFHK